jgi:WD40 repeat protein
VTLRVLHTAGGHKGEVRSIRCVSGDDRLLVSTSSDHTAIVWQINAEEGPRVKCILSGHSAPVAVACALKRREGDLLVATTSNDQDVRIWTVNTESYGSDFFNTKIFLDLSLILVCSSMQRLPVSRPLK